MNDAPGKSAAVMHATLLMEQGRYAEAEGRFREALGGDPGDPVCLHNLAFCQYRQPNRSDEAERTILAALAENPNDADHHGLHALILLDLGRIAEGRAAAGRALELAPASVFAHNAMTAVRLHAKEWPEAEAQARKALALDADDPAAANHLALALRMQGRHEENAEQIRGMLARDPEDAATHVSAGWSELQAGRTSKAEEHFREALRIDPDDDYARAGLLTAFKARSPLYRLHLRFALFMSRFTSGRQWMILIGLWLGFRALRLLKDTPLGHVAGVGLLLYFLFALWQHVADGVGHFILLLDRRVRPVLRRSERWDGLGVGGSLVAGFLLIGVAIATGAGGALFVGTALVAAAVPAAHVFRNTRRFGRAFFASVALLVVGVGAAYAVCRGAGLPPPVAVHALASIAVLLWVASTWLANVPALRQIE